MCMNQRETWKNIYSLNRMSFYWLRERIAENLCDFQKIECFGSNWKSRTKIPKSRSFLSKVRDFPHFFEFADTALVFTFWSRNITLITKIRIFDYAEETIEQWTQSNTVVSNAKHKQYDKNSQECLFKFSYALALDWIGK